MPIEAELISVSPAQCEAPACQARCVSATICVMWPALVDHVVAGDLAAWIGEPLDRLIGRRHAGVVQHDHVGAAALAAIAGVARGMQRVDERASPA